MAPRYIPVDRDQQFLLPPDLRDWLAEGHLAHYVIDIVEALDTKAFHADRKNDETGRPAHDPDMLLALLIYSYALGVRSSREIESRCLTDVAFRVLSANTFPDHSTIARFRQRHDEAIKELFFQSVALCAKAGMVKVGVIAIDGTKMKASASLDSNRKWRHLRRALDDIVDDAGDVDAEEDRLYGQARGDELPEELADPATRKAAIKQSLGELEDRIDMDFEDRRIAKREGDLKSAQAKVDQRTERHRAIREQGKVPREKPVTRDHVGKAKARLAQAHELKAAKLNAANTSINLTDSDSRIMRDAKGGALQGYNAQVSATESQVILAAELHLNATDYEALHPIINATRTTLQSIGYKDGIGLVLADAGYYSEENLTQDSSPDLLIATTKARNIGASPGPKRYGQGALAMQDKFKIESNRKTYKKRSVMVEPVFGQIKSPRNIRSFTRRGKDAAAAEWKLICATHNLLKHFRHA